jgi:hypothetical protein
MLRSQSPAWASSPAGTPLTTSNRSRGLPAENGARLSPEIAADSAQSGRSRGCPALRWAWFCVSWNCLASTKFIQHHYLRDCSPGGSRRPLLDPLSFRHETRIPRGCAISQTPRLHTAVLVSLPLPNEDLLLERICLDGHAVPLRLFHRARRPPRFCCGKPPAHVAIQAHAALMGLRSGSGYMPVFCDVCRRNLRWIPFLVRAGHVER